MKNILISCLLSLSLFTYAQSDDAILNRPNTELTIGASNLNERVTIDELIYSDYFYDSYTPFDYLPTNIASINIGLRQKLGKGSLRVQGHFGNKNQVYSPDNSNGSSSLINQNLSSLSSGGKIGYDFFSQYNFIEVNYGFDFVMNYNKLSSQSEYKTEDYVYDQFGNYTITYINYETKDSYSGLSVGAGLNIGLGIRVSEKIKIGLEAQYYLLRGIYSSSYKSTHPNNPQTNNNSGKGLESDFDPMGLIYIAFGL